MELIISYVDQYFCEKHVTPSVNEIAQGVDIPKTTAYRYLVEMDNRGMIEYDGQSRAINTPMINKFTTGSAPCPVVGSIPCGTAEEKEECIREYISLPVSLFGKGEFYILEACGDSMVDAGIDDGDIVVALLGDNESTLKVFGGIDDENQEAILLYRNEAVYPGKEIRTKDLIVQGVARHVIKAL